MRRRTNQSATVARVRSSDPSIGVTCQVCGHPAQSEEAIVLRNEQTLVFAVCYRCTRDFDIVMRPSTSGVEVHARHRTGPSRPSAPPDSQVRPRSSPVESDEDSDEPTSEVRLAAS